LLASALGVAAALVAVVQLAPGAAERLGAWIANACDGRARLTPDAVGAAVFAFAMPILAASALAAVVAHIAQTGALWLPRRRVASVPHVPRASVARAGFELAGATLVAVLTIAWFWRAAPIIAESSSLARAAETIASFVAALVTSWVALGVLDALARHAALARTLAMTDAEKREDDRLAAADPRWRARRRAIGSAPSFAGVAVVVVGDDVAIAVAWHATRQPVPTRAWVARGLRATQLVALARRHGVAIHRDRVLASALVDGFGPVPEAHWPRLADIIAATRR
jgi:type III secretory pathway component EscU